MARGARALTQARAWTTAALVAVGLLAGAIGVDLASQTSIAQTSASSASSASSSSGFSAAPAVTSGSSQSHTTTSGS